MISEPLIVGMTKMNLKGGIWMKCSNSVNQNQHCISQAGQNDTEKLVGEVDKWDVKTDVNVSGESKPVSTESVQLYRALKVKAEGLNLTWWIKES